MKILNLLILAIKEAKRPEPNYLQDAAIAICSAESANGSAEHGGDFMALARACWDPPLAGGREDAAG
ncbi:unnamed protein product [Phyllotreta striolata]|uniref:Uncharacterized protein n=1 Tax=Phyllotreta striolata TaxID=444603 RepID=A0A9N9TV64_PHYSR|nr:unnamed protein product [Phyllotreta striolata]